MPTEKEPIYITQDSFDDAVKDNIETFDMSPEEAVASVIEEYKMQEAVDLRRVIFAWGEAREAHPATLACKALSALSQDPGTPPSAWVPALRALTALLDAAAEETDPAQRSDTPPIAYQWFAPQHVVTALRALQDKGEEPLTAALECVAALCRASRDLQAHVGNHNAPRIIHELLFRPGTPPAMIAAVCRTLLAYTRCHEEGKCDLYTLGGVQTFSGLLKDHARFDGATLDAICQACRSMCLYDDLAVPASKAFTIARQLGESGAVLSLHAVLRERAEAEGIAISVLECLKALCVNDDICKAFNEDGGVGTAVRLLEANLGEGRMVHALCVLFRQIGSSDDVKHRAVGLGILATLLKGIRAYKESNASVTEGLLGVLTVMTLRNVEASAQAAELGAIDLIAECMGDQPGSAIVQKGCSMALRNMVVRNPELRPAALARGFEGLIRTARSKFPKQCEDVGLAAMRDLGLEEYK